MAEIDFTVGAVVERSPGEVLIIEERVAGRIVLTQPGGHLEAGETLTDAIERETLEEAGCRVRARNLIELYQWYDPGSNRHFLRAMYAAILLAIDNDVCLDDGVRGVHWMTRDEIDRHAHRHRNRVVGRVLDDYARGQRADDRCLQDVLQPEPDLSRARRIAARL